MREELEIAPLKFGDFKTTFPKWQGVPMEKHVKNMDEAGIDLLA